MKFSQLAKFERKKMKMASSDTFLYYHFRSTLKCDDFFAYVYVSNLTVLSGYVSRLTNETLAVMLRN